MSSVGTSRGGRVVTPPVESVLGVVGPQDVVGSTLATGGDSRRGAEHIQVRTRTDITAGPDHTALVRFDDIARGGTAAVQAAVQAEELLTRERGKSAQTIQNCQRANLLIFVNQDKTIRTQHEVCTKKVLNAMVKLEQMTKKQQQQVTRFFFFPPTPESIWGDSMHGTMRETTYLTAGPLENEFFKRDDKLRFIRALPAETRNLGKEQFAHKLVETYGIPESLANKLSHLNNKMVKNDSVEDGSVALVEARVEAQRPRVMFLPSNTYTTKELAEERVDIITEFFHKVIMIGQCADDDTEEGIIRQAMFDTQTYLIQHEHLWFEHVYKAFITFIKNPNNDKEGDFLVSTYEERETNVDTVWKLFVQSFVENCIQSTFSRQMKIFNDGADISNLSEYTRTIIKTLDKTLAKTGDETKILIIQTLYNAGKQMLRSFLIHDYKTIVQFTGEAGGTNKSMDAMKRWIVARLLKNKKFISQQTIDKYDGQIVAEKDLTMEVEFLKHEETLVDPIKPVRDFVNGFGHDIATQWQKLRETLGETLAKVTRDVIVYSALGGFIALGILRSSVLMLPVKITTKVTQKLSSIISRILFQPEIKTELEQTEDKKTFFSRFIVSLMMCFSLIRDSFKDAATLHQFTFDDIFGKLHDKIEDKDIIPVKCVPL